MLSFRKRTLTALVLGLAVALPAFAAEPAAPKFEKYLPDAADGVITINVRQLLDSELIKKAGLDKALAGDDAQKSFKELGLDPLKDIERVIISGDKEKGDDAFVIVQGKFDPAKLAAAAEATAKEKGDHVKVHKFEYGTAYELTNLDEVVKLPPQAAAVVGGNLKGRSLFATIPDKGHVVLVGSKEAAETVLAKAAGKKTTKLSSKDLSGLLAKMDLKQSVAVAMPAPGGEEKVKSITGGITVTSDVKTRFTVAATDADAAKQVDTAIGDQIEMARGLVKLVALQEKGLMPALDILDGVKHEAKDASVGISSDIKGETLQKLAKAVAELVAKQGGGNKPGGDKK
jgi:hypothetical protein